MSKGCWLMSWRKTGEVEPYYVEGLLHLDILFESGVVEFDGERLHIDTGLGAYERQKVLYRERYIKLVRDFYLPKREASGFLDEYVYKSEGVWHLKRSDAREFADHYWERYRKMTMPF